MHTVTSQVLVNCLSALRTLAKKEKKEKTGKEPENGAKHTAGGGEAVGGQE